MNDNIDSTIAGSVNAHSQMICIYKNFFTVHAILDSEITVSTNQQHVSLIK